MSAIGLNALLHPTIEGKFIIVCLINHSYIGQQFLIIYFN